MEGSWQGELVIMVAHAHQSKEVSTCWVESELHIQQGTEDRRTVALDVTEALTCWELREQVHVQLHVKRAAGELRATGKVCAVLCCDKKLSMVLKARLMEVGWLELG